MFYKCPIFLFVMLLLPAVANGQLAFFPPLDQGLRFEDTPVGEESVQVLTMVAVPVNDVQQRVLLRNQNPVFTLGQNNFVINPGEAVAVEVTFAPRDAIAYHDELTILAGGPAGQVREYQTVMTGRGVEAGAPEIHVEPLEIALEVIEEGGGDESTFTISNRGDAVLEFEVVAPDVEWLEVPAVQGELDPDAERDVRVSTTDDIPDNGRYSTEIPVRSNDRDNPEIVVTVILTVAVPEPVERRIELVRGWSMISSNVDFTRDYIDEQGPDIQLILADIIDHVLLFKDGNGHFCASAFDFWGIPAWNTAEGYLIKTDEETVLTLHGYPIPPDREIELEAGWNMIAYYPDFEAAFEDIFAELVDRDLLQLAKNGFGRFYAPDWGVGGDIVAHPGEGFLVRVSRDCRFRYPDER